MKKIAVIVIIFSSLNTFANPITGVVKHDRVTDTTVLPAILVLPLNSYIGKPVDSLLSVLPNNYSNRGFLPVAMGYSKGVYQSYFTADNNTCAVEIFIDSFQFLPIPNRTPTSTWNFTLARQEIVAFIKVIKNNNICLYGCNNSQYYY